MNRKINWARFIPVAAALVIIPTAFNNCAGGYQSYDPSSQSQDASSKTPDANDSDPNSIPNPNPSPSPLPSPVPSPAPSSAGPPLSFNDARFSKAVSIGPTTLSAGGSLTDRSIVEQSGNPSIVCNGGCVLSNVRVNSGECVRLVQNNMRIEDSYLEATGKGDDHADVIQAYSPGSRGTLTLRNTTLVAHNTAATAGLFIADSWKPDLIDLESVVFWGGPYGLRLHADGYNNAHLRMKDVCFVGPFGFGKYLIDGGVGGNSSTGWFIDEWTNVNECVIQNGQLVVVKAIPKP